MAVSDFYAEAMTRYLGLPADRVRTVPLGIHAGDALAAAEDPSRPFTVGYFARIAPEKGLHLLAEAYVRLRKAGGAPARLEAAGYMAPEHRGYLERVEATLAEAGLASEFRYHGTLDRAAKMAFLRSLDVASVPTPYAEPKGMSVLEALACGVPVVQPDHGAFPEIVARTAGGVLFAPGDAEALARELRALQDGSRAAARAGRARRARGARGILGGADGGARAGRVRGGHRRAPSRGDRVRPAC